MKLRLATVATSCGIYSISRAFMVVIAFSFLAKGVIVRSFQLTPR